MASSPFSLFVSLFFSLLLCVSAGETETDEKSCRNDDETCQAAFDECLSDVILYEGIPDSLTGKATEGRTSSLMDKEPARFDKVARFTNEFEGLELSRDERVFHVSANGDHEGWFVRIPEGCFSVAKKLVARELVALMNNNTVTELVKQVDLRGPHRLLDEQGRLHPSDTNSQRLHLLLPREAFIHESVREGFDRTLDTGVTLKTLSLSPRVFVVDPILSLEYCQQLIEESNSSFQRSPEHHYSPGYENYRTSLTGYTPSDSPAAKELFRNVQAVTAMPKAGVEFPQLLKYEQGSSWYKVHMDYFHNFKSRPVEEVRMFVRIRTQELLRLNVTDIQSVLSKDEDPLILFDHPNRLLRRDIVLSLTQSLSLEVPNRQTARRALHYFMVNSDNPVSVFERVCILFAEKLFELSGASEPLTLAEKYYRLQHPTHPDIIDYIPFVLKPVETNRHATVLPILRPADRGGNTAFPHSQSKLGVDPDPDEEFDECKRGLIVKPEAGQALLFYNRLPSGEKDPTSQHAGCPPKEGEKFAANCFTWDSDRRWANRFLTDISELYDRP